MIKKWTLKTKTVEVVIEKKFEMYKCWFSHGKEENHEAGADTLLLDCYANQCSWGKRPLSRGGAMTKPVC